MPVIASKGTVMDGATGTCCGCRRAVVLGLTDRGAILPLNPGPAETGALAVSVPAPGKAPQVRYLRGDDTELEGEQRMVAHWDTSPACRIRKRAARKPAPRRPHLAVAAPVPARRDMTLDELAAADLDAILARVGAPRAPKPHPAPTFGSAI